LCRTICRRIVRHGYFLADLTTRNEELSGLTGIRFYAALFVLFSPRDGMQTFSGKSVFFNAGVVGGSFFLVLSGFILTYNYAGFFRDGISRADLAINSQTSHWTGEPCLFI